MTTYHMSVSHSICDNGDGQRSSVVQVGPSLSLLQHSGHDKKSFNTTTQRTAEADPPSFCSNFRLMLTSCTSHDNRETPANQVPFEYT